MNKILVINGPNLNMLGQRETDIYGSLTWDSIFKKMCDISNLNKIDLRHFQSNCEGAIIDELQKANDIYKCIIINAGAFTHYSYAIRDAISMIAIPVIEVHMSNIYSREEFRHKSVIAPVCVGQISGFNSDSYLLALEAGIRMIKSN